MMNRHFRLSSELGGAIVKRFQHAKNQLSVPGSLFNQFVTDIIYTSALRLLALRGLRTLRVRRVSLREPEVAQSNLFWEFFTLYEYCKQKYTINLSFRSENMIFEIYTTKNPMSTVGS